MGFKTDRMSAQDRVLNQFDRVLKNEKYKEKESLKDQLEKLEKEKPLKTTLNTEEKVFYTPLLAAKYRMEETQAKKEAKNKKSN